MCAYIYASSETLCQHPPSPTSSDGKRAKLGASARRESWSVVKRGTPRTAARACSPHCPPHVRPSPSRINPTPAEAWRNKPKPNVSAWQMFCRPSQSKLYPQGFPSQNYLTLSVFFSMRCSLHAASARPSTHSGHEGSSSPKKRATLTAPSPGKRRRGGGGAAASLLSAQRRRSVCVRSRLWCYLFWCYRTLGSSDRAVRSMGCTVAFFIKRNDHLSWNKHATCTKQL